MSEFEESRIAQCPYCKTKFAVCEGTLCDCWWDAQDILEEMNRGRDGTET